MSAFRQSYVEGRGRERQFRRLPQDYLKNGYFKQDSILWDRLIVDDPRDIVRNFSGRDLADRPLEYSQIRKFFSFARQMEYRLRSGESWESVRQDVLRMSISASDAVNREVAPRVFREFMEINSQKAAISPDAFLRGFLIHFESIIAFYPRRRQ